MPAVGVNTPPLQTKLYPPPLTEDFVPRLRLRDRLEQIENRPLTLVSAPAGYGKSTLLSAWLESHDCCSTWLTLDEYDNDLSSFEIYFLAAIRNLIPGFGDDILASLNGAVLPSNRFFVQMICAEFDKLVDDIVLVIDDYQLITNEDVHDLLAGLMHHPHPRLHLVLLTRHDPPLPLNNWRARHSVLEIRSLELRFSLEETTSFLRKAVRELLDDDTIVTLNEKTEGWAAGLRMAVLSFNRIENFQNQIGELSGDDLHVAEYLVSQVLTGLPVETQSFLLQTSILDRFSIPLCQAVISLDDLLANTQNLLQELVTGNTFTIPLDNSGEWFRYHHLFQQFLQIRLAGEFSTTAIAALHKRASGWFEENGLLEEALQHALAAGEMEAAVQIVSAYRQELMNRERFQRLSRWVKMFPQRVVEESPDLLLLQARFAQIQRYDMAELSQVVDKVERLVNRLQLDPAAAASFRGEINALRGAEYYSNLDPDKSFACCKKALDVLPLQSYSLRSYCRIYGAVALQMLGDLSGAYEWIALGQREDLMVSDGPQARNIASSGFVSWIAADLTRMQNIGEYMLGIGRGDGRQQTWGWGHYFLACVHYHRNELESAEYHAQKTFDKCYVNHVSSNIYCAFILALIQQARGRPDEACKILDQAAKFAAEIRSMPFTFVVQSFMDELAVMQGRAYEVSQRAERMCNDMQFSAAPFFYTPQLTIPKVLMAAGRPGGLNDAACCLQRLREFAESTHNDRILIEVLALEAILHSSKGDKGAAFTALEQSLSLARPGGFIRLYVDLGPVIAELLQRMQSRGLYPDYITSILAAFPDVETAVPDPAASSQLVEPLTDREEEILDLLAKRYTNKEIAAHLYISPATVKRHSINIYQKLGVHKRRDAVVAGRSLGLVPKI